MRLVLFNLLFSIFRFCATRWVGDRSVAERAIEVWSPCVNLIRYYESLSKSKRPKNKSYERLVNQCTDLLVAVFVATIFIFNWDSLHARLKSHYKAWSYKKMKNTKRLRHTGNLSRKNLQLKDVYWF